MSDPLVDAAADHSLDAEELWRRAGEEARGRAGQLRAVARRLARMVLARQVSVAQARALWLATFERVAVQELVARAREVVEVADRGHEAVTRAVALGGARSAARVTRADRERRAGERRADRGA